MRFRAGVTLETCATRCSRCGVRRGRVLVRAAVLAAFLALPGLAQALTPYMWDEDDDRVDDRMESVDVGGIRYSFDLGDTLNNQRFEVVSGPAGSLFYGVYVVFDHDPTDTDLAALAGLGMPVLQRYRNITAVRSLATFAQVQGAANLAGVERIEAIPILYAEDRIGNALVGARDPSQKVFPTLEQVGGPTGDGVVVAILDTGVNDAPSGSYPGHESLTGKFLGGGVFQGGDSTLDTRAQQSMNPVDRGGSATLSHATHVAGIILGSGGPSGYAPGVAPGARFVDVKVLNDAGLGTGVAEALDWCIQNRARDWGAGSQWSGIDVINLSLSSPDESDGNDVVSRLAAKASQLGIVVVASVGNGGRSEHIPSPAAGDGVLAVGAIDDQRTPLSNDDQWASFNDYGPRASDRDFNPYDEQKPDLLAPGVAVLSANGDLSSAGDQYIRLTGTSMAAAYVSGVVASLRSGFPALRPYQIAGYLRLTARRDIVGPSGTSGIDPRWSPSTGFGVVDLYATWLELSQPRRSQIRRLTLSSTPTITGATLWTQREMGATHFVFERAPDLEGGPGAFAPFDSVAAHGDRSLVDGTNLQSYARDWAVPESQRGGFSWYRVSYTEDGVRYDSPALRYREPLGTSAATIEVTIVHNAYDSDIDAVIQAGVGQGAPVAGRAPRTENSVWIPLPGSSAAESSTWVTGASTTGNVSWTFRIEVPAGTAEEYLPPSPQSPWWLTVTEGGFINRSGRITSYRMTWHGPQGDFIYEGGPAPAQTVEGQVTRLVAPSNPVAVDPGKTPGSLRFGPNPVASGDAVRFSLERPGSEGLQVFDIAGRQVGRAPFVSTGAGSGALWIARDGAGHPLASGLYLVRIGSETRRLVVVAR